jgi:xanthine dehydrogenase YagS FAD-binding subunit
VNLFGYVRAGNVDEALHARHQDPHAQFIGGGTNLLDLVKENVTRPSSLIDINHLPLNTIEETPEGGLRIGALVTNTTAAYHDAVAKRYPLLSDAILAGASPQLRNMATMGGNLLQRTRCWYFYDTASPCNKRTPGSGCSAIDGVNRIHAILGASEHCIAVHPSDMAVALATLEARIRVQSPRGERVIPMADFHRLPEDRPEIDSTLEYDELITSIELPAEGYPRHCAYVKVRDRNSYAFALVSAAVGLKIENGSIVQARVALGGVAHKPWRRPELEAMLQGPADPARFEGFARALVEGARGYGHNDFKVRLAPRTIMKALYIALRGMKPGSNAQL